MQAVAAERVQAETREAAVQQAGSGYQTTIPAHRAAVIIARNFAFVQTGWIDPKIGRKVEPTVDNLARLIDYATRFPVVLPVLKWFVKSHPWYESPEMRYRNESEDEFLDWLNPDVSDKRKRLEDDIERVRHGVRLLQKAQEQIPTSRNPMQLPTAAGWSAAHLLERHFKFRQISRIPADTGRIALIVDTSSCIARVERGLNVICAQTSWEDPATLRKNLEQLRRAMRMVELVHNRLPEKSVKASNPRGVVIRETRPQDIERAQRLRAERCPPDVADLSRRLAAATTPAEEQAILTQWRSHVRSKAV